MTMTDVSNLVNQLDCSVEIEVTGMPRYKLTKAGVSTIKVPMSSLSRTMQFIHRSGGKVVNVKRLSSTAAVDSVPAATTTPPVEIEAIAVETPATPEVVVETLPVPEVIVETTQPTAISTSRSRSKTTAKSAKTSTKRTSKKKK